MTVSAVSEEFSSRAEPFRGELLAHCYRMLGSIQDAEDLVQETLLRAWRARDQYDEGRASLRTWLYRIATNACLTALASRGRRTLPAAAVAPGDNPEGPLLYANNLLWLQPFPDARLGSAQDDPASALVARATLRLAFVAALQLLPPRQRAILILRDVLDWSAAEVAATLETTTAAINSALQRARARLAAVAPQEEGFAEPGDPQQRAILERYVVAFERADIAALTALLTADARMEMPPALNWYIGRDNYTRFIVRVFAEYGATWRMVPIVANGQPAVAAYLRAQDGRYRANSIQVFTITDAKISRNIVFYDPALFPPFGLPPSLPAGAPGSL